MSEIDFEIKGLTPLVMHNGAMADPDSEWAVKLKELTSKRGKSAEERAEIGRVEWRGSLYWHDELGPVLSDSNLIAALVEGARFNKQGKNVESLVSVTEPFTKLDYKGPRDLEKMYSAGMFDRRVVSSSGKPGGPKVVRTRALFKNWTAAFSVAVDDELDASVVIEALRVAGKRVGLCERKKFRWGRFEVTKSAVRK